MSIDEARAWFALAAEFGLTSIEVNGVKASFAPALSHSSRVPTDDSDSRLSRVREDLAAIAREQEEDLYWSAPVQPPREREIDG